MSYRTTKTVIVDVTQEDIKHGEQRECEKCPIARAIHRIPELARAYVNESCVEWPAAYAGETNYVHLPEEAQKFISDFDNDREARPFKFELEIPE